MSLAYFRAHSRLYLTLVPLVSAVIATRSFRRLFRARERSRGESPSLSHLLSPCHLTHRTAAPHDFFDLSRISPSPPESPRVTFWRRGSDQSGLSPSLSGRRGSEKYSPWTASARGSSAPSFATAVSPGTREPMDVEARLDTSVLGHTTALGGAGPLSPLSREFQAHVPLLKVPDVAALRRKPSLVAYRTVSALAEQEEPSEPMSLLHEEHISDTTSTKCVSRRSLVGEEVHQLPSSNTVEGDQQVPSASASGAPLQRKAHCTPPTPTTCAFSADPNNA